MTDERFDLSPLQPDDARFERMVGGITGRARFELARRAAAQAKLATFTPKIGYPNKWKDYSSLEIKADDLVGNFVRATHFASAALMTCGTMIAVAFVYVVRLGVRFGSCSRAKASTASWAAEHAKLLSLAFPGVAMSADVVSDSVR